MISRTDVRGSLALWVIGCYKLAKALALVLAGVFVFRLDPDAIPATLLRLAKRSRLDPDDQQIHTAIARLSGLDRQQLEAIGVGLIVYSLLYVAEGVGLFLKRRWAEYLVTASTGFLIPFELYEVVRRPTLVRVVVILANVGIVAYLVARLRREHRERDRRQASESPAVRPV
ncbi:DUF2127 domain-containing protein [Singulisphaera rosea]